MVSPTILQKYVVKWYHTYLLHISMGCTEATISQQYCPDLRDKLCNQIKVLQTCQKNKNQNNKYGLLLSKKTEDIALDRLLVDRIGTHEIRIEGHDYPLLLNY